MTRNARTQRRCNDCMHCDRNSVPELWRCNAPQNRTPPILAYCSTQRSANRFNAWLIGTCGRNGRWFMPRNGGSKGGGDAGANAASLGTKKRFPGLLSLLFAWLGH